VRSTRWLPSRDVDLDHARVDVLACRDHHGPSSVDPHRAKDRERKLDLGVRSRLRVDAEQLVSAASGYGAHSKAAGHVVRRAVELPLRRAEICLHG